MAKCPLLTLRNHFFVGLPFDVHFHHALIPVNCIGSSVQHCLLEFRLTEHFEACKRLHGPLRAVLAGERKWVPEEVEAVLQVDEVLDVVDHEHVHRVVAKHLLLRPDVAVHLGILVDQYCGLLVALVDVPNQTGS